MVSVPSRTFKKVLGMLKKRRKTCRSLIFTVNYGANYNVAQYRLLISALDLCRALNDNFICRMLTI